MQTQDKQRQTPNTYLRQFFRYLGSRECLLNNTAETATTLAELGGTHSFQDYCQFLRNAREEFNDPAIGLRLGRINQLSSMHGPVGTAIYNSSTLYDCLEILHRYGHLRYSVIELHWVENDEIVGLEVTFKEDTGDMHPSATEILLLAIIGMIAMVSRHDIQLCSLELNYPAPSYFRDYQQAFRVSSIQFSRPATRILIPKHTAIHATDTDFDPQLRASAIERCEELLKGSSQGTTTSAIVTQLFTDNPGQLWSLTTIAKHLNMSPSTLQRRLKEENIRFQQLQSAWLMTEARHLLSDQTLSIEIVALLLGYSDVSTFRQACNRWYGIPPNDLRRQLKQK